jgi:transposase InsO family protein
MKQKRRSMEEIIRIIRQADGGQTVRAVCREHGIKTIYIEPASPWQNGWIESFHARLRDECLNRELLLNLREAQVVIEDFRLDYNQNRPPSKLGYLSPNQWIEKQSSSPDSARPAGLAPSRLEQ